MIQEIRRRNLDNSFKESKATLNLRDFQRSNHWMNTKSPFVSLEENLIPNKDIVNLKATVKVNKKHDMNFKYQSRFSKYFKNSVGITPNEFSS